MLIVNPLKMQWQDRFKEIFPNAVWRTKPEHGYKTYLFMWCNEDTVKFINGNPKLGKYIVYVRRYEYYTNAIELMDWNKVDAVILVNDFLAYGFEKRTGRKTNVVYNGVDPSRWTFRERTHGNKIAWVGFINQKKNLPLALQVMMKLPKGFELHIAGALQDPMSMDYALELADKADIKISHYGQIPEADMDKWLDDKDYLLSTALSEGCPNNVIEAMAKGIMPVVHCWPGAGRQFGEYVFKAVDQAVNMITANVYESSIYRNIVEKKFGLKNYDLVRQIVEQA